MNEVTIPLRELTDALSIIETARKKHPERDDEPFNIGTKITFPPNSGEWSIIHNTGVLGGLVTIQMIE